MCLHKNINNVYYIYNAKNNHILETGSFSNVLSIYSCCVVVVVDDEEDDTIAMLLSLNKSIISALLSV